MNVEGALELISSASKTELISSASNVRARRHNGSTRIVGPSWRAAAFLCSAACVAIFHTHGLCLFFGVVCDTVWISVKAHDEAIFHTHGLCLFRWGCVPFLFPSCEGVNAEVRCSLERTRKRVKAAVGCKRPGVANAITALGHRTSTQQPLAREHPDDYTCVVAL
jgi:hypothetical protein